MNLLDKALENDRQQGRMALIPFVPAGDPDLPFTVEALRTLAASGATAIEIGFPFSDPIADGPVIQAAYTRALANGFTIDPLLAELKKLTQSPGWATPLLAMASYSLIWRRGMAEFVKSCVDAGLSGIVVPDLPAEEADEFASVCKSHDMKLILLVTPTTAVDRLDGIVNACTGFVYVVSVVGITGKQLGFAQALPARLAELKARTALPRCVGFGISAPEHVHNLKGQADGVIVGTAFVRVIENASGDRTKALKGIDDLARILRAATVV